MPLLPQPEDLEAPKTHHFKVKTFKKVKPCGICRQAITREGCVCKGEQLAWLGSGWPGPGLVPCSLQVEQAAEVSGWRYVGGCERPTGRWWVLGQRHVAGVQIPGVICVGDLKKVLEEHTSGLRKAVGV